MHKYQPSPNIINVRFLHHLQIYCFLLDHINLSSHCHHLVMACPQRPLLDPGPMALPAATITDLSNRALRSLTFPSSSPGVGSQLRDLWAHPSTCPSWCQIQLMKFQSRPSPFLMPDPAHEVSTSAIALLTMRCGSWLQTHTFLLAPLRSPGTSPRNPFIGPSSIRLRPVESDPKPRWMPVPGTLLLRCPVTNWPNLPLGQALKDQ